MSARGFAVPPVGPEPDRAASALSRGQRGSAPARMREQQFGVRDGGLRAARAVAPVVAAVLGRHAASIHAEPARYSRRTEAEFASRRRPDDLSAQAGYRAAQGMVSDAQIAEGPPRGPRPSGEPLPDSRTPLSGGRKETTRCRPW